MGEFVQGHPISPTAVKWRHKQNPTRESIPIMLRSNNNAVGRIWIQFRQWVLCGRYVTLASPIDFLVQEGQRDVTNFLRLFSAANHVVRENADGLFHTSNPITDGLYQKLFKLKPITELSAAAIPVRPIKFIRNSTQRNHFRKSNFGRAAVHLLSKYRQYCPARLTAGAEPNDSAKQAILSSFQKGQRFCSSRSLEILTWRFRGADEFAYQMIWIYERQECLGYVAVSPRDIDSKRVLFVVDVMLSRELRSYEVRQLWLIVFEIAVELNRDLVAYFFNAKNQTQQNLIRFPIFRVPRKFIPQKVPIFVKIESRNFAEKVDYDLLSGGYFTLYDFDLI